ncbi:hypothetical protein M422DRAFT_183774 [Sphaerobolus stellatus SS14]|uniref:WD40 repeat-like protein n=1 Tax=Sphaerobolus stellatus (strain SS14) TaxID=990650 RepID=A0A0C9UUQ2_SPHS4|nr:hypothetical protein M422DRAFT_183774 [Sphaerobolus stellatus SS14]
MGALLSEIADDTLPLRPLHLSFREFLLDPKASGPFCVSALSAHGDLARISLNIVNQDLRFNICDLDTSYLRNKDIPNLPDRILENIPFSLRYVCRAWAIHFSQAPEKPMIDDVIYFFRHKLLYWFEVLALIQGFPSVQEQLLQILTWCKTKEGRLPDLANFAEEGRQFVEAFGNILVEATSHLYLSALSFIPASSIIAATYAPQFPNIARVTSASGELIPDPLQGHTGKVVCLAFSPDGLYIASGSQDSTVHIWDVKTSKQVSELSLGHTHFIEGVKFSPNGEIIASSSLDGTVRFWNVKAQSKKCIQVSKPLEGHTSFIFCLSFSFDGKRLVSGSHEKTLHLWNVETGDGIGDLLKGHLGAVIALSIIGGGA